MKKFKNFSRKWAIIFLTLILLPALYLMVKEPIYNSYDSLTHIARISEYHNAILESQFPPRIAPSVIDGIGYPLFVVNYHLPYIFCEIFMFLFNDARLAFKAVMSTTYILSGVFFYLLIKKHTSTTASLVAAITFSYLPYRFANLYFRGSLGESVALMFIVLVLLSLHYGQNNFDHEARLKIGGSSAQGKKTLSIFFIALSVFGIITSHTVIFIIFAPFFALYTILIIKPDKKSLFAISAGFILGILASSFQLLPSLFEKNYLKFDDSLFSIYTGQFVKFPQLYRLGGFGENLGTYFQAGIVSGLIIFCALLIFLFKRNFKILFFLAFSLLATFLVLNQSRFLWNNIILLKMMIFPWRFISLIILCVSFLAAFELDLIYAKKIKFVLSFFLVVLVIYTSRHYFFYSGIQQQIYPPASLSHFGENDPIWSSEATYKNRPVINSEPNVIAIKSVTAKPYEVTMETSSTGDTSTIVFRKLYFPGWRATVNNQKVELYPFDGLISLRLFAGINYIHLYYEQTTVERFANLITLITFFILIIIFLSSTFWKKFSVLK